MTSFEARNLLQSPCALQQTTVMRSTHLISCFNNGATGYGPFLKSSWHRLAKTSASMCATVICHSHFKCQRTSLLPASGKMMHTSRDR